MAVSLSVSRVPIAGTEISSSLSVFATAGTSYDQSMTDGDFRVRMPSGTDDPLSDAEIQSYREEINRLDNVIRDAIQRRTEVSRAIGKTRLTSGGTKLVHTREVAIINEFHEQFGREGVQIAKALLQLGRGRLG